MCARVYVCFPYNISPRSSEEESSEEDQVAPLPTKVKKAAKARRRPGTGRNFQTQRIIFYKKALEPKVGIFRKNKTNKLAQVQGVEWTENNSGWVLLDSLEDIDRGSIRAEATGVPVRCKSDMKFQWAFPVFPAEQWASIVEKLELD